MIIHDFICNSCGTEFKFRIPQKGPKWINEGYTEPGDPLPSCPACRHVYVRDLTLAPQGSRNADL